jgi:hypothetical protein
MTSPVSQESSNLRFLKFVSSLESMATIARRSSAKPCRWASRWRSYLISAPRTLASDIAASGRAGELLQMPDLGAAG